MYWKLGGYENMIVLLSIWSLQMTFIQGADREPVNHNNAVIFREAEINWIQQVIERKLAD